MPEKNYMSKQDLKSLNDATQYDETEDMEGLKMNMKTAVVLNQERYDEARKLVEGWNVWHDNKLLVLSVIARAMRLESENERLRSEYATIARPFDEWHEDQGEVLWWTFPIEEPPYCGSPLNTDWPGYHTHWTQLIVPQQPESGGSLEGTQMRDKLISSAKLMDWIENHPDSTGFWKGTSALVAFDALTDAIERGELTASSSNKVIPWIVYDKNSREIESHVNHLVTNGHRVLIAQHAAVPGEGTYSWMINDSLIDWVTHYARINLP